MEDKLLILRCKRRSKAALTRIYEKYKRHLLILAVALLNDTSCAEDVVHDVFVGFVQGLADFELTGSLKCYLATCVANRARNVNRARHRRTIAADSFKKAVRSSDEPGRSVICNEELKLLGEAMGRLPYEQREVILLHMHSGATFGAIAAGRNMSVNTVKSRYRYGIEKLRSIFNHEAEK
ncbi:MAG: RNA polymerase sigma factor [Phycisphaerales bacterium]|nr:MAG: RNA polymerase sigma factor [Phycisphaerales bacterium]